MRSRLRMKGKMMEKIELDDLEMSVRTKNVCKNNNFNYLNDFCNYTEKQLLLFDNFGRKSFREVKALLSIHGLSLNEESGSPSNFRDVVDAAHTNFVKFSTAKKDLLLSIKSMEKHVSDLEGRHQQVLRNLAIDKSRIHKERNKEMLDLRIGGETYASIARKYSVSATTIHRICNKFIRTGKW